MVNLCPWSRYEGPTACVKNPGLNVLCFSFLLYTMDVKMNEQFGKPQEVDVMNIFGLLVDWTLGQCCLDQ